jgi:hypothetical protein
MKKRTKLHLQVTTVNKLTIMPIKISLALSIQRALLAWEPYVNITKASEIDNKLSEFNITLTKVPK